MVSGSFTFPKGQCLDSNLTFEAEQALTPDESFFSQNQMTSLSLNECIEYPLEATLSQSMKGNMYTIKDLNSLFADAENGIHDM